MSDFATALSNEIASLQRELEADPRYLKLQQLKKALSLYSGGQLKGGDEIENPEPARSISSATPEMRQRAVEICREQIRGRLAPTRTRDLLQVVEGQGILLGGSNPVSNLSAMLSKEDDFKANGKSGWILVEPVEAVGEADREIEVPL